MKKFLLVLLIAGMLLLTATPTYAQSRYGLSVSAAVETSTSLVLPVGTWVYGWKIYADENSSFAAIADCATYFDITATNIKDEIGEATIYDSKRDMWDQPIKFADGVSVVTSAGVVFIYYGPAP